jgi:nucleotide-binding universal stress UspA family protein
MNDSVNKAVIVVGVGATGHSDGALVAAFALAQPLGASVELVHATDIPHHFWPHVDEVGVAAARDAALERIARVLEREHLPKLDEQTQMLVTAGNAADALLARAREHAARLIVLGPHRREGALDFGNTVRAVLAKSPCPVWVQQGPKRAIKRILCAIDLGPESLDVLTLARDFARSLGAELEVLHCFVRPELGFVLGYPVPFPPQVVDTARDSAQRALRLLIEPFDWRGVVHRTQFAEGEPAQEILSAADDANLIVLGTHARGALANAMLGSVATSVLRRAHVPVLALRSSPPSAA